MHTDIKVAWIQKLPAYIAIVLLLLILGWNMDRISGLFGRLSGFGFGGVSLNFSNAEVPKALEAEISGFRPSKALKARFTSLGHSVQRMQMVVIHDESPVANWLAGIFRNMGASVDVAICSKSATNLLQHHYDVILSDIDWKHCDSGPKNAIEFLNQVKPDGVRVVFYISKLDGENKRIPRYAHDLTNTFEGMLNGVLDVVSRSDRLAL